MDFNAWIDAVLPTPFGKESTQQTSLSPYPHHRILSALYGLLLICESVFTLSEVIIQNFVAALFCAPALFIEFAYKSERAREVLSPLSLYAVAISYQLFLFFLLAVSAGLPWSTFEAWHHSGATRFFATLHILLQPCWIVVTLFIAASHVYMNSVKNMTCSNERCTAPIRGSVERNNGSRKAKQYKLTGFENVPWPEVFTTPSVDEDIDAAVAVAKGDSNRGGIRIIYHGNSSEDNTRPSPLITIAEAHSSSPPLQQVSCAWMDKRSRSQATLSLNQNDCHLPPVPARGIAVISSPLGVAAYNPPPGSITGLSNFKRPDSTTKVTITASSHEAPGVLVRKATKTFGLAFRSWMEIGARSLLHASGGIPPMVNVKMTAEDAEKMANGYRETHQEHPSPCRDRMTELKCLVDAYVKDLSSTSSATQAPSVVSIAPENGNHNNFFEARRDVTVVELAPSKDDGVSTIASTESDCPAVNDFDCGIKTMITAAEKLHNCRGLPKTPRPSAPLPRSKPTCAVKQVKFAELIADDNGKVMNPTKAA